ncbi:MAG TPA: 7-cyano-7-deazaguanine synthase QueC [Candidatus Bathyarchaeia archaeon]|nr:7-cyano-7-deazaguanine synthase QueC [Candidatus Bathyarchaeia archaeon]
MSRAVVLLSAGLDSVVSFKLAHGTYDEVSCLTFDYGQKARNKEVEFASKICATYGVSHHIVTLPWYANFKGALTDGREVPQLAKDTLEDYAITSETAKEVWVPARNTVFLAIATAFCENYSYETLIVGFNKEEAQTFPDNSGNFVASFNNMLKYATLNKVEVVAPLIECNKTQIVALGLRIEAPLQWSWSCYAADALPCAVCESCLRRSRAFQDLNKTDPLLKRLGAV